jgi:hypothetical protein
MATELQIFDHTFKAGADLTALQFRICRLAANAREVVPTVNATVRPLGVLQDKPAAIGRAVAVRLIGISKVVAGAAIAIHSNIASDASGRGIATTTAGDYCIGVNLEAAAAVGDIITVLVMPFRI